MDDDTQLVRTAAAGALVQIPEAQRKEWWTQAQQDAFADARQELETQIAAMEDRAAGFTMLGSLYQEEGKYEQAEAAFRKAIEIEPTWLGPRKNLANLTSAKADQNRRVLRELQESMQQFRVNKPDGGVANGL